MNDISQMKDVVGDVHVDLLSAKSVLQLMLEGFEPEVIGTEDVPWEYFQERAKEIYIPALQSVFEKIVRMYKRVDQVV